MDKQKLLKQSVDVKSCRNSIILWSFIVLLGILLPFLSRKAIILDIFLFPIAAYFLIIFGHGLYELLRDPHKYLFLHGTPIASHTTEGSSKNPRVYFILSVNDGFEDLEIETNAVFSTDRNSKYYFGDLFGKTFLILYDKEGERVVVLKAGENE